MRSLRAAIRRRKLTWTGACLSAGLGFALAGLSACFDPPAADVLFSCQPGDDPACPEGYRCEADGCCHKEGSDVDANLGRCSLAAGSESSDTGDTETTGAP